MKRQVFSDKLSPISTTGKCQRYDFRGGFWCGVKDGKAVSDFILVD